MSTTEIDAGTPRYLRDRYAVAGIGETSYTRGSGKTTRQLATWAVRNALADAGLRPSDVDGMLSYSFNDSTFSTDIAGDLGIRLNFYMDVYGGGSSTEALIGIAIGVLAAGMCQTVVVYRAMNGYSQLRIGGTGRSPSAIGGSALHTVPYGWMSAGQWFSQSFMRHMYDYGTTPEQVATVKVIHSEHASNNPKAYYQKRVSVDDVLSSRMIVKPLHLLDCCVETDNATAVVVTGVERARDCRHRPALIRAVVGRCCKPRADMHYQSGPISTVAGHYARDILWPNAGVGPEDIDLTGSYDAFTFTTMLQLEDYGFCKKGEGGRYVSDGRGGRDRHPEGPRLPHRRQRPRPKAANLGRRQGPHRGRHGSLLCRAGREKDGAHPARRDGHVEALSHLAQAPCTTGARHLRQVPHHAPPRRRARRGPPS